MNTLSALNVTRLFEFMVDANAALLGGALLYWSKLLAANINAWSVKPYQKFPKLKMLPSSHLAGKQSNYKTMFMWFRICGALLFVVGLFSLVRNASRLWW